jgi:sulfur-oxidizing protein SoxX
MLEHKLTKAPALAMLGAALALGGGTALAQEAAKDKPDYTAMSAEELAEYLIFEAKGFDLDEATQEGGTVRERLQQDKIQELCSVMGGGRPDGDTLTEVREVARGTVALPEGGIELGDWKKGEAVARSGYGFRVGHKDDVHGPESPPGGNCYACHQLDPEEIAYGTLGPSLTKYGQRGTSEVMLEYTYTAIANPHVTFPCTQMPRFGTNGILTQQQILDVMAYLMAPDSPVNK